MNNLHSFDALSEFIDRVMKEVHSWRNAAYPSAVLANYSDAQFREFIQLAYDASLFAEESKPTQARLVLGGADKLIPFDKPIEYTARRLAKLAPIIGLSRRQLVVTSCDDKLLITAIRDPFRTLQRYPDVLPEGNEVDDHLLLSIYGPAHLSLGGLASKELRIDTVRPAKPLYKTDAVLKWLNSGNNEKLGNFWRNRALESLVRRVREGRTGGCVVITPSRDVFESPTRIEGGHGVEQYFFREAIENRISLQDAFPRFGSNAPIDPNRLHQAHFSEQSLNRTIEFVASLASVDGALVISADWEILRFGAKITAEYPHSFPETVRYRGTRHKSAFALTKLVKGLIAIVISQDGDVSVMSGSDEIEGVTLDEAWVDSK